jgi:hypothetical protein
LIGGADTGVNGATHIIIVHYFRTLCQSPSVPSKAATSRPKMLYA